MTAAQIPDSFVPRPPPIAGSLNYNVSWTVEPFSLLVTRVADGEVLFDSAAGSLAFYDQFLEIRSAVSPRVPPLSPE